VCGFWWDLTLRASGSENGIQVRLLPGSLEGGESVGLGPQLSRVGGCEGGHKVFLFCFVLFVVEEERGREEERGGERRREEERGGERRRERGEEEERERREVERGVLAQLGWILNGPYSLKAHKGDGP
jgi:hypothetical protein